MPDQACAVRITQRNFQAIISEAGQKFDRDFLERWFTQEGEGYFVRDPGSRKLDCNLFLPSEFHSLYMFARGDEGVLFREVIRQ